LNQTIYCNKDSLNLKKLMPVLKKLTENKG